MPLVDRIHAARLQRAQRRTEKIARRELAADLAAFVTPAERTDLELTLNRHSPQQTRVIREILDRQDQERQHRAVVPGGLRAA
ncbi:hypothetical protein [Krasilnikovia sp. MM14-A1259]|uniref:hypothetical protein n=1 Tax=Krasilnikovia sp. MM14-A1259 TaxID=3373539 RepID=UPI0037F4A11F